MPAGVKGGVCMVDFFDKFFAFFRFFALVFDFENWFGGIMAGVFMFSFVVLFFYFIVRGLL